MAEEQIDPEQQRKVIKWLAVGTGVVLAIVAVILGLGAFADAQKPSETPEVSEELIAAGSSLAEEFITNAGNFGLSDSAVESNSFTFVQGLLTTNKGYFENTDFGISRGEAYEASIIPLLDPRGSLDTTQYFAATLNGYTPDWSGQLLKYSTDNVLITTGEPYVLQGRTLLPVQASFTSTLDLYKTESSFGAVDSPWEHYTGEYFETVDLVLSLQGNEWYIWSIENLEDYPFLLNTWDEPNWRNSAPNVNVLQKVS